MHGDYRIFHMIIYKSVNGFHWFMIVSKSKWQWHLQIYVIILCFMSRASFHISHNYLYTIEYSNCTMFVMKNHETFLLSLKTQFHGTRNWLWIVKVTCLVTFASICDCSRSLEYFCFFASIFDIGNSIWTTENHAQK